jgi:hypothetical protein
VEELKRRAELPQGHGDRNLLLTNLWTGWKYFQPIVVHNVSESLDKAFYKTASGDNDWAKLSESRIYARRAI